MLREAYEAHIPMRLARERIQPGWIHGYVIGLSREFCLIAEVGDAMRFDGYVVVLITDLSQMEEDPSREFVEKVINEADKVEMKDPSAPAGGMAAHDGMSGEHDGH